MPETISFTIPKDAAVMRAVSDYLQRMAAATPVEALHPSQYSETAKLLKNGEGTTAHVTTHNELGDLTEAGAAIEAKIPASEGGTGPETDTEEIAPPPPASDDTVAPATDTPTLDDKEIKDIAASVPPPAVELDGNGLPWDVRIHSSSKAHYAAPRVGWKLKRGVSGALVEQVEGELRAAMAASPDKPVVDHAAPDTTDAATAFAAGSPGSIEHSEEAAPPPPATETAATTETPAAAGSITNFAELNVAITAAGIAPGIVTMAVQKAGLQAYPLLATRTDLVPFVVGQLGLGPVVEAPAAV